MSEHARMAQEFYGFGRWDAPFWFLGPEPGVGDGVDATAHLNAWQKVGGGELVDCVDYHRAMNFTRWEYAIQPTWGKLIRLLLAFAGEDDIDKAAVLECQRSLWGRRSGQTCVIELSSIAAASLATIVDRESFRAERISTIRRKIEEHQPTFVVMYSRSHMDCWEQIVGGTFDDDVRRIGRTVACFRLHPTRTSNVYWEEFGRGLRRRCDAATD
jgi:hypothetical protein